MTNRTLQQHINDDYDELNTSTTSGQRRRHLENEIKDLEKYQTNHPNDDHDPTPLELYCDVHPDALECKIYEL
jgi:hypothetical protein